MGARVKEVVFYKKGSEGHPQSRKGELCREVEKHLGNRLHPAGIWSWDLFPQLLCWFQSIWPISYTVLRKACYLDFSRGNLDSGSKSPSEILASPSIAVLWGLKLPNVGAATQQTSQIFRLWFVLPKFLNWLIFLSHLGILSLNVFLLLNLSLSLFLVSGVSDAVTMGLLICFLEPIIIGPYLLGI